ncbi:hypothetical protein BJX61DRAFT_531885 [Aspergillus egyptiacus]|nr:hypothetical protein BJX61DRAFT_531885 [Aspergillus egyptiacus]
MPSDTRMQGLEENGFRLRRTHEKSRNGCLRCKQQRKKCDESRPSCTRCSKHGYQCRYVNSPTDSQSLSEPESAHLPVPGLHVPPGSPRVVISGTESPYLSFGRPASFLGVSLDEEPPLRQNADSPGHLDATELGLLAHYLTHTCQIIPVDDRDLYALSVGVPNLAFNSQVVMSSLIALAAACKCHDITKQAPPLEPNTINDVRDLLALAERHHTASLRHIQAAIMDSDSYDYVLANAALMVLYASASHSIRVHLAATAKQAGRRLPNEVLPQHSQWMSFTRAAHMASTAILRDLVAPVDNVPTTTQSPVGDRQPGLSSHLFLPLVASTYSRALESLRRRTEYTTAIATSEPTTYNHTELNASLETVSILEKCASAALSRRETNTPGNSPIAPVESPRVSPWVAHYMIGVTSMESPHVLRRIIMSFLNKAPAEYLNLVQSVLDSPSVEARAEKWMMHDSPGSEGAAIPATHLLAMDIFAHWLVLVMLLDGVWWIGGIGQWELGQVVSLMKTQKLLGLAGENGETWWPESMYLVKKEITPGG